ncbi:MAG: prepilin-type N-terminal cleavage/methylation domain-containing protein [Gloeomargarita sp. SKYG116]|nr:prepilin-type N-terminal cleavage/methylation domain-containing protein [Gloeomargarita sp. SKYG116]MCS7293354.1 prepilin-type N-terminal cleavage/methylation domain-containing protein [Gloeomargarita sp. SKYB120]MDW8178919.1 prepilin-type N-terminal cleavage/methylation domain-containing protein [Gloeomargarita sp. SKYBB_i_bin120]MDW8401015.1 prepilin-type N-terminal cleavage/methylation domain-containing protein [Gloeomargarita sp. SKYGB_i_bin116]
MQPVKANQGFTLVEVVVIAVIIGILAAIAAPSWLAILTRQRLYNARANALDKIREAQSQAIRTSRPWEVCFRDRNGFVEVSVQPGGRAYNCRNHTSWQSLMDSDARTVAIDPANTTSNPQFGTNPTDGYSFRFGPFGDRAGLGGSDPQLVFIPRGQPRGPYYCVVAEGIIGQVREGKLQRTNEGRLRCR